MCAELRRLMFQRHRVPCLNRKMTEQVSLELVRLPAWKRRAMCASAAERVAPVFRRFGSRGSVRAVDAALDLLWRAVPSGRPRVGKVGLRRLPEAKADDSHSRKYYAGRFLLILRLAIDSMTKSDPGKAGRCLAEVLSLCDDFDTLLTSAPGQTYRYDPKHPPIPGRIERFETRAQLAVVDKLRGAEAPDERLLDLLRKRSRKDGSIYDAATRRLRLT